MWGAAGELVNNVIYNWGGEATVLEPFNPRKVKKDKRRPTDEEMRPALLNFVGNSWIPGPNTVLKRTEIHLTHATDGTAIYFKGNVGPNRPAGTSDGRDEAAIMNKAKGVASDKPAIAPSSVTVQSAEEAKVAILDWGGAILPARDAVDRRVVQEVRDGKGKIIDTPNQVGGYPNYPAATAEKDSDGDGMPDVWEDARGLDKAKANANGRDLDLHYDNIEVYVNSLFPKR